MLALFVFCILAAVQCQAEGFFENGQEYQYIYQAYTLTGVREPTRFGSSFGIRGNLLIQKQATGEAILKLSDLTFGMHNGDEALLNSIRFLKKPDLATLEKPFKLSFSNGKITGIDVEFSDVEWSVNIKKALASKLQMDVSAGDVSKGETAYMRTVEDTISGTCNTTYTFSDDGKGRYLLFKQRTQKECSNVPRVAVKTPGTTNCGQDEDDELQSTTQSYYKLSRGSSANTLKVNHISSFGYQILQWYPPAGSPLYNRANTTMELISSGPITKPIVAPGLIKHYASLRYTFKRPIPTAEEINLSREEDYFHPEEPVPQQILRNKAVPALTQLKQVLGWSPLNEEALLDPASSNAIQLITAMSLESLQTVWKSVEKDDELKNLYTEILPLTGTNPAALMIKELILSGKLSELEAQRLVALIPYYLRLPSEKLLTSWEDLLKGSSNIKTKTLKTVIALSFGHLIGITCAGNTLRPCKNDNVSKYSRMVYDSFKSAKTHQEMVVSLMALRNSNLVPAIERLIPHTKSGSVPQAVRPHVIFALQFLATSNRDKFLSAILPIIHNTTETTEVRIAAISTLFRVQPTLPELEELFAVTANENNQAVLNFILTSGRNYAESKNPCLKSISSDLQLLMRRVEHLKTDFFRSSNRVFDFHDEKYGFGGGFRLITVYGEESRAPLIISARVNYRFSKYRYIPLEVILRIEGVDEAYVRLFLKLDPKDFKLDSLKDLLQKTLKISPRQKSQFKVEMTMRSQDYDLMYHHMSGDELGALMEGSKTFQQLLSRGLKLTRINRITLGGHQFSWRPNDIGLPVGVDQTSPGSSRYQLSYGNGTQSIKISRSIQANIDMNLQMATYLVVYNPLGVSQGIVKSRGSRTHLPANVQIGFSPSDSQVEIKMSTPTEEKPLSLLFTSKTLAVVSSKGDSKALSFLKESCPECELSALVSRGENFRKGLVARETINHRSGMESHAEVHNCETYTGKASIAKLGFESFKPSEINSHGSTSGFLIMGFMQMRNYFHHYPPAGTCSMKTMLHSSRENPAEAIEIRLKIDSNPPPWRRAPPGMTYSNVKGSVTLLGTPDRKWNVEINMEKEPFNIRSLVSVKIARLANPTLGVPSRALCVNVKTIWSALPEDIFEIPSVVWPSVHRDVTYVWGDAPANECPKPNAKGISTVMIKVVGNITEWQQDAATSRNSYPYDRCDLDSNDDGRTGIARPMTQACLDAVLDYATPRSYKLDIKYENMSPSGQTNLDRINTLLRPVLLPYLTTHSPLTAVKSVAGTGHIELKMDVGEDDINLLVKTEQTHSLYENIDVLKNTRVKLRNARFERFHLTAIEDGWVGVCDVAPKAVVTFDKLKMKYADLPRCYTLISADCSAIPRYAIFAKKTNNTSLPIAAKVYVGGHTLEFSPMANSSIEIKANDKIVKMETNKPYVLSDKDNITQYAIVKNVGVRYFIEIPALKLSLRYTGDDISTTVPAVYRSQLCGLCGDFNGQFSNELVGPSGCIMKNATDLAFSYVLRDKNCKETIQTPVCAEPGSEKKSSGILSYFNLDRLIRS